MWNKKLNILKLIDIIYIVLWELDYGIMRVLAAQETAREGPQSTMPPHGLLKLWKCLISMINVKVSSKINVIYFLNSSLYLYYVI